jgi:hypothetical protein
MATVDLTAQALRTILRYDPETGHFFWSNPPNRTNPRLVGRIAGWKYSGDYWHIRVQGRLYRAHRLAWLYVHGEWPKYQIDHINGIRTDNRIANLRDVSHQANCENKRSPRSDNKSGYLGVSWSAHGHSWKASIGFSGKVKNLGYFATAEAAHAAYVEAKRRLHGGCTI